jgi:uncharacterized membrane protein YdjX (TVP38/TMEM64 family)
MVGRPPMLAGRALRGYAAAAALLCALMLALFGLVQLLEVPVLSEESPDLGRAGVGAAVASFALLAADVVLPVPSSGVMIANGVLFGWLPATALSLAGSVASALLGGAIGRRGGALLHRLVAPDRQPSVAEAIQRRGAFMIIVTRPVPIVAETTAILAGAAGMSYGRLAAAAAIGSLPPAVLYSLAGAVAGSFGHAALVFAGVLALSALVWLADRRRRFAAG